MQILTIRMVDAARPKGLAAIEWPLCRRYGETRIDRSADRIAHVDPADQASRMTPMMAQEVASTVNYGDKLDIAAMVAPRGYTAAAGHILLRR